MHDRIRLALSAAGIAVVTLLVSGVPLPFTQTAAQVASKAPPEAITASVEALKKNERATSVAAEIPVSSDAAALEAAPRKPQLRAPRIRHAAGADLTSA